MHADLLNVGVKNGRIYFPGLFPIACHKNMWLGTFPVSSHIMSTLAMEDIKHSKKWNFKIPLFAVPRFK